MTRRISLVAVAAISLCGTMALADQDGSGPAPNFMMGWDASEDTVGYDFYDPDDLATTDTVWGTWTIGGQPGYGPERTRTGWRFQGDNQSGEVNGVGDPLWTLTWDCIVNPDPFVDATINVTNNSASTQTFFIYMPLPISPVIPATTMSGSVSAVVSEQNFDDATLSSSGGGTLPIYEAYIDPTINPAPVRTQWSGYALSAGTLESASDGGSFAGEAGPPAASEIAILLRFDLTAGDSASVTGIFDIQPIPAPAALPLLAIAGLVTGGRRRRS